MPSRFVALLLLSLCIFAPFGDLGAQDSESDPFVAQEERRRELFRQIAPSVVFIAQDEGFGSGFFVSTEGMILTNAHVVGEREKVRVVTLDGTTYKGEVIEVGEDLDLALVKIEMKGGAPMVSLGNMDDVRIGDWVASIGHGRGGIWTLTSGFVSNIYPAAAQRPIFQTQIPLNPGNSGGPVFNRHGDVIGIVTAGITDANSINFAIPTGLAITTLDKMKDQCQCIIVTTKGATPIYVQNQMVGSGPRLVVPVTKKGDYEVFTMVKGKMKKKRVSWPKTKEVDLR